MTTPFSGSAVSLASTVWLDRISKKLGGEFATDERAPGSFWRKTPGFADAANFKCAADAIVERSNACFDFHDGVADGFEAKASIGLCEDLAFYDAGIVADGDELHLVAGDLMVRAVGDNQPAN